ncbi:MAG: GNAT family N-acetyltransferase, partial [Isosphaeraceae bacterium]
PLLDLGPGCDETFLARAIAEFVDGLRRLRVVSAFVRLHPLFGLPQGPLGEAGFLVSHGETVSIDLMLPREEIWRQTRCNHRRDIQKTEIGNCVTLIDNSKFDEFISIYYETMNRREARDYYYFDSGYFEDLRTALDGRLHLGVVKVEGRVACAGLFTEVCGIVQYHLSGTRGEFLKRHPLKALINFVRYWAKDRGNRVFHLGGGLGGRRDTLFEFKAGFSHARHPFYTWRIIIDEPAYSALVGRWESLAGIQADEPEGFFPAYRKSYSSQGASSPGCLEVGPSLRVDHCRELERPGDAQEREHDPGESGAHRESEASRHGTAYQAPA